MFKNSKIYKITCLLLLCLGVSIICLLIINPSNIHSAFDNFEAIATGQSKLKFGGIVAFKEIYRGVSTIFFNLLVLTVIPLISHYISCINRIKGSDNFIVTRIGLAKYYLTSVFDSIKDIWYYPIIINFFALFVISFDIPIFGEGFKNGFIYLVDSDVINFLLLTFFQIISWSILNIYCFLFSQLIHNKYVYSLFLLLFSLLLILVVNGGLALLTEAGLFTHSFISANAYWFNLIIPYFLVAPGAIDLFTYPDEMRLIFIICLLVVHIIILGVSIYYTYKRRTKFN